MTTYEMLRAGVAEVGGLVSITDIGRMRGITRQSARDYTLRDDFPAPVPGDSARWFRQEVHEWLVQRYGPDYGPPA